MKFSLIDDWKKAYKLYSLWFFAIIGLVPDLFNLAVQYEIVSSTSAPAILSHAIKLIAFFGAASRLVKQKETELEAEAKTTEAAVNS